MLELTHWPPPDDPHPAWYVTCRDCGYVVVGEAAYVGTLADTPCPLCAVPASELRRALYEVDEGEWG